MSTSGPEAFQFSVVTPSLNQLEWLQLCVLSVADQVAQERAEAPGEAFRVEHLVQDAGSDGIAEFAARIKDLLLERHGGAAGQPGDGELLGLSTGAGYTLRILRESDSGMYDAVNRGLSRTTGEHCSYLNCDEQYLPGALRRVKLAFRGGGGPDVVFADALLIDAEGKALSYRRAVLPGRMHTRLCHLNTLTCATFFRRSVIEKGHVFPADKKVIGDAVWVHGMLEAGIPMACLRHPTSAFTFTGANMGQLDSVEGGEQCLWVSEQDAPPSWLRLPVSGWHRARKLFAGAYVRRDINYRVYTAGSGVRRQPLTATGLGFGWPS